MVNCFPADVRVILSDESCIYGFITGFAFGLTHHHKCYIRLLAIVFLSCRSHNWFFLKVILVAFFELCYLLRIS